MANAAVRSKAVNNKPHWFRYTEFFSVKMLMFSLPSVLTYVLGAQKNRLIETVLLSTHNKYCGWETLN